MRKIFTLAAILGLVASSAKADGLIATASYADRSGIQGTEIEFGYRKTISSFGINILPVTGILYPDPDSRYREETFSNGTTICRDTSTGQFANKEKCSDTNFSYAFSVSADYAISNSIFIGGGVRIGEKTNSFVMLRARVMGRISIHAKAGDKYSSMGLSFGF